MGGCFIIGCGDVGGRLAARERAAGHTVRALARRPEAAEALRRKHIEPVSGDLDDPDSLRDLPVASSQVFYFAPPPAEATTDPRMVHLVAALQDGPVPERVVYLSTSGVYGDRGGAWVDEVTAPAPRTDRARRRLHAETVMRDWGRRRGVAVVVLRVGGIYGDGRLPAARLRQARPVLRPEDCGYTNRIHVEDLVTACQAAAERGGADRIYNVSDGRPGTMTEYLFAVADALGLPRPPVVAWDQADARLTAGELSYLRESRRLDNRRMVAELGVELRYPDLASGLAQAVAESPLSPSSSGTDGCPGP